MHENIWTRYKIELALAGMEDGVRSSLTVSERLAVLEEAAARVAIPGRHHNPSGIYARWHPCSGAERRRALILATSLANPAQIRREMVWGHYFGMDPAQDLPVIIEDAGYVSFP